ncbi:MAG: DUF4292 domain-containing protein [Flavobacteriales bacterium]|nr:DUF4292 domain-containing protein [Flavobacteriales bacterium]
MAQRTHNGAVVLLVGLVLASSACHPLQSVIQTDRVLPLRSWEKVLERAVAAEPVPVRYYAAKVDVDLKLPEGDRSFKGIIRSVQDSALWLSIVPALGIEAARALITTDSTKFMDRLHDTYFLAGRDSARARFGMDPDLALFQDALLGRAIGLDPTEKYRVDREEGLYVLTSKERRRFIRAAEDLLPEDTLAGDRDMPERRLERTLRRAEVREAVVLRYWIEPDSFRVVRVRVSDLVHDQHADVRYEDIGGEDRPPLPHRISLSLSDPARHASGTLQLHRVETTGPLNLPFKVPEKFVPME